MLRNMSTFERIYGPDSNQNFNDDAQFDDDDLNERWEDGTSPVKKQKTSVLASAGKN